MQPPRDQMLYPIIDSLIIYKPIKFKSSPAMQAFWEKPKSLQLTLPCEIIYGEK